MGVDPSLSKTGVAVYFPACGKWFLELVRFPKLRGPKRLVAYRDAVGKIIAEFNPSMVAIEGYSYSSVGRTFDLGELGGILKVEMLTRGIRSITVPPSSLKLFTTNNGLASKARMLREVNKRYLVENPTDQDDLADAAALARFAYVAYKGDSKRRCELEAVKNLRENNDRKKKRVFKRFWTAL